MDKHKSEHNDISKIPQVNKISLKYAEFVKEIRKFHKSEKKSFQNENNSLLKHNDKILSNGYAL